MSDKISPVAVMKDALRAFRMAPAAYLPLLPLAMAADYVSIMAPDVLSKHSSVVMWVPILIMVLVNPWLYRRIMHRTIQCLRGREEPVGKFWKFVMGVVAIGIVTKLLAFVIGFFPGMGLLILFDSPNTPDFLSLINDVVMMILFLRFGFVLTAIAVDDQYDYSLAWRLGKKHTLRMIVTTLPCLVSYFGLAILFYSPDGGPAPIHKPAWLLAFAVSEAFLLFTIMIYSAWYVRLRERHEAAAKALVPEETVSGPPLSTDAGLVQNQETWEKV
ncbi:hypothetical protein ACR42D_16965 [Desulfovibrio caledoniensis]